MERDRIIRLLRETDSVISTATRLGVTRTALNAMTRKLGFPNGSLTAPGPVARFVLIGMSRTRVHAFSLR